MGGGMGWVPGLYVKESESGVLRGKGEGKKERKVKEMDERITRVECEPEYDGCGLRSAGWLVDYFG